MTDFFVKMINGFQPLPIFAKKAPSWILGRLLNTPEACNFIKKETLAQVLSCEFCKIFKNTFLYRKHSLAASDQIKYYC